MSSFRARRCDMCGREDDRCFEVTVGVDPTVTYTFDCFECAIQRLAAVCERCGCRIVGHGVDIRAETGQILHCCASCARWGDVVVDDVAGREPALPRRRFPGPDATD